MIASARNIECNAKKVTLDSTTGQQIQIFELQVFSSGFNIALNGKATQSSSWSIGTAASKAIDGSNTTFSHTNDPDAFIEVDFGGVYSIESVVILNRFCKDSTDSPGCLCRLSNATMSLMDNNDDTITTRSIGNTCGITSLTFSFDSLETNCQVKTLGFYLLVKMMTIQLKLLLILSLQRVLHRLLHCHHL